MQWRETEVGGGSVPRAIFFRAQITYLEKVFSYLLLWTSKDHEGLREGGEGTADCGFVVQGTFTKSGMCITLKFPSVV